MTEAKSAKIFKTKWAQVYFHTFKM